MKVTYNWLKDFVEIKIAPQALAEKLTMAGLEVTSLEERDGDFVFEIEVTANRPDCLSIIGIAREVAAITGKKLKLAQGTRHKAQGKNSSHEPCAMQPLSIKIENKKDCLLYTAKIIKDVKVGPSPDWLKERLELVGVRSVNNIVDITNYILFTHGEPLHAFDLDKLSGDTIIIRRAKQNEKIITIDGQERALNTDVLLIADRNRSVALAGIMGGKDTEVTEITKNILLEAAIFNPIIIRRARQNLGLQSESSYRFERGVDPEIVENASWRAVELIQELVGGRGVLMKRSGLAKTKKKTINLQVALVQKILGINIAAAKVKKILNSLAFKTKGKTKNNFIVTVPSHRPDVNLEIDLIEEIARIYGYEFIPKSLPAVKPQVSVGEARDLTALIKKVLVGLGLNEVITYSLIDRDWLQVLALEPASQPIEILNPLSKEQEVLRPALMPSLLKCLASNLNQKQSYLNLFEIAKVFSQSGSQTKEELVLGIALCGTKSLLLAGGRIKEEVSFLHLKGILEILFARLGTGDYTFNSGRSLSEVAVFLGKEKIGSLKQPQKPALEKFEIKNKDVFVLELSLDKLFPRVNLEKTLVPLPMYPAISRDISLVLKEEIKVEDILQAIREKAGPLLKEVKIIDYYKGKQIPAGFKSLTISCLYRRDERTLTEMEVNPMQASVVNAMLEKFGAKIR